MVSYMPSLIYGGLSPAMSTLGIPLRDEGPMNSFHCLHNCGYTFLPLNDTMEKAVTTNKAKYTYTQLACVMAQFILTWPWDINRHE